MVTMDTGTADLCLQGQRCIHPDQGRRLARQIRLHQPAMVLNVLAQHTMVMGVECVPVHVAECQ